jgi:hypothetical protein
MIQQALIKSPQRGIMLHRHQRYCK